MSDRYILSFYCAYIFVISLIIFSLNFDHSFFITDSNLRDVDLNPIAKDPDQIVKIFRDEWMIILYDGNNKTAENKQIMKTWHRFAVETDYLHIKAGRLDNNLMLLQVEPGTDEPLPYIYHVLDGVFRKCPKFDSYKEIVEFVVEKSWYGYKPIYPVQTACMYSVNWQLLKETGWIITVVYGILFSATNVLGAYVNYAPSGDRTHNCNCGQC